MANASPGVNYQQPILHPASINYRIQSNKCPRNSPGAGCFVFCGKGTVALYPAGSLVPKLGAYHGETLFASVLLLPKFPLIGLAESGGIPVPAVGLGVEGRGSP